MTKPCEHWQIESYMVQPTGDHAGLWGCVDCKRKFVPLDLEQEKDAARYRWVRQAGAFDSEIGLGILSESPEKYDAAVDSAMLVDAIDRLGNEIRVKD